MSKTVQESPTSYQLYDALSAARRCYIVEFLANADETVTVRSLASHIVAVEHDTTPAEASGPEYKNAYNASVQTHLPALADVGVVRYNRDRQRVTKGPEFETAVLLLRLAHVTCQTLS